jgi:DNA end-binding protein Ku
VRALIAPAAGYDNARMPRSIWSGAISFGLVNVPVKLYSAVSRKTVRFNQLNAKTGHRIQQKRVDPETGEEVAFEDLVKGYELGRDRYVVLTPDELDALDPERTRTIDIEDFVDLEEIDPVYYDHPYYLVPDKGAAKAYGLLLEAMRDAGKVAIARVVLRSKEQLVAIRPAGDGLMMETMIFHDEVVPQDELEELPDAKELKVSDRELKMARQLIDSLSSEFAPERYHDEYREKVLELIERKAQGEEIAVQPEAPKPARVPDLMAALEASLAAVKGGGDGDGDAPAKKPSGRSKGTKSGGTSRSKKASSKA